MELEQKYQDTKAYLDQIVAEYEPLYKDYMSNRGKHPLLNAMAMRIKIERAKLEKIEAELKKKIQ